MTRSPANIRASAHAILGALWPVTPWRRDARTTGPHCRRCGHDLSAVSANHCPRCGLLLLPDAVIFNRPRPSRLTYIAALAVLAAAFAALTLWFTVLARSS